MKKSELRKIIKEEIKSLNESNSNTTMKLIIGYLNDLEVKYKLSPDKKKILWIKKPINKSDSWYSEFDDVIWRWNLKHLVK